MDTLHSAVWNFFLLSKKRRVSINVPTAESFTKKVMEINASVPNSVKKKTPLKEARTTGKDFK